MEDLYIEIRNKLFMKMKFLDRSIKGIKGSAEEQKANIYNKGIRDAMEVLDQYKEKLKNK